MFELVTNEVQSLKVKVIGVGSGGIRALREIQSTEDVDDLEFYYVSADVDELNEVGSKSVILLGKELTKGLGSGRHPKICRLVALEQKDDIHDALSGADVVFIVAGLGGGVGSGAIQVIAEIAKNLGILTIPVVSTPFKFEGRIIKSYANNALSLLINTVDSVVVIPSQKISVSLTKRITLLESFSYVNKAIKTAVLGLTNLLLRAGMINVDLIDVKTVMSIAGYSAVGIGCAKGEHRAEDAAKAAIRDLVFSGVELNEVKGILVSISAGVDLSLGEFSEIGAIVESHISDEAIVVVGTVIDLSMIDEAKVTIYATGLDRPTERFGMPSTEFFENIGDVPKYEELPKFLRAGDKYSDGKINYKLVADSSVSDDELAELINHLSNVYRSVGGDELVVANVNNLPPNSRQLYVHRKRVGNTK